MLRLFPVVLLAAPIVCLAEPGFEQVQATLKAYCVMCHSGKAAAASLDLTRYPTVESMSGDARRWNAVLLRVRAGEMPPKAARAMPEDARDLLVNFTEKTLRSVACVDGIQPPVSRLRRLNRNEYSATVRDLLNIHINAGHALPSDGAGGEGFDNAAETLFLSPMHAEKYFDAAREALEYAIRDPKARARFLTVQPGAATPPMEAARQVLAAFLPRAFRRPVDPVEVTPYLKLFAAAQKRGDSYETSIVYALRAALVSPQFLFLQPTLVTRLSYFLWGTMPDDELLLLSSEKRLNDPEILRAQVVRMLKDVKAREFAERFVEQWLGTRELGRDIKPDPMTFPGFYDAEIQSAVRYEPILFFQELLASNLPVTNFIDSRFTILTNKLKVHYGLTFADKLSQQPKRVDLPENSHRGGLLSMAAVLALTSYPRRTSPVLRGKWVLDAMLGTPPPPPPPDVPELADNHAGAPPRTVRERLEQHRENPVCAGCHNRMDPLGFGLENYDVSGKWRTQDAGQPIDARGELSDGSAFEGPEQMKAILLKKKDLFYRNLTSRLLGYALNRGLTLEDQCAVGEIVEKLKADDRAQTLVGEIVLSAPFRQELPAM